MEKGFIMLSRKLFSHRIWKASRTFSECEAWIDLIQSARFEATVTIERIGGRDITYGRGQYPASISFLSKRWGWLSEKKVRNFLDMLKKEGMITTDAKQGMNIITLCKYDDYNTPDNALGKPEGNGEGIDIIKKISDLEFALGKLTASIGATVGQGKGNNNKKEEEYNNSFKETSTSVEAKKAEQAKKLAAAKAATLKRKEDFYNSLIPYVERYGKDMIRAFFDYWSELNKSETKMRLDTEKTWELPRRLSVWANREKIPKSKPNFTNHDNNKEYADF